MNTPIIFMDIDGPLSYGTWMDGNVVIETIYNKDKNIEIPYPWVKEDCDALNTIISETQADIVVSSDWRRFYTLGELKSIFQFYGIYGQHVIDITTHFNPIRKMSSPPDWDRACEIKSWVKTFKPKHWIAIDDMPLGYYFTKLRIPKWRHISVDVNFSNGGKLRDKVEECVKKLKR